MSEQSVEYSTLRLNARLLDERRRLTEQRDTLHQALQRIVAQCEPGAGECADCERAARWALMAMATADLRPAETPWQVGDWAICVDLYGLPMCFVQVHAVAPKPRDFRGKYYGVTAITPVVDWSAHYPPSAVVRQKGEQFNAHYSELRPIHRQPTDDEIAASDIYEMETPA